MDLSWVFDVREREREANGSAEMNRNRLGRALLFWKGNGCSDSITPVVPQRGRADVNTSERPIVLELQEQLWTEVEIEIVLQMILSFAFK